MQYAGRWDRDVGIVTPKLISPERRILAAGWSADASGGARMTPRLAGVRADEGRANVPVQVLGAPAAFLYIRNALLRRIGGLDLSLNLDDAVADLCRRCWEAGMQVVYWPAAEVTLGEGVVLTPPADPRPPVRGRDTGGPLPVIYVTEDTGVGGGHRDIFEHLNRLHQRGHQVELWTLADPPNWFPLEVPVRSFPHYGALVRELAPLDAIKVATWWNTAHAVWRASVTHGIPVYFVQDIETSYYPDDAQLRSAVLAWYRQEFAYMTISPWNRDRLAELGLAAELIPPGIDLENFRPGEAPRRSDMLLALGRTNPLKNLPLTLAAWRALPEPRPELVLFGIEPQVVPAGEQGIRYVTAPSDEQVAELLRQATVFVQTSTHEGFCLPPLESMATGGAVVCTDAHGNREFCVDGVNCLMPGPTVESVSLAIKRLLDDPGLRARLGQAGIETAAAYSWPARIDALESFLAALSS
jgi:glycosyltransferase involved in cell wall biosynthesis